MLRLKGKVDEALAAWRTALAIDPENAEAQFQVAVTLWQRGSGDEATDEMQRVLEIDPQHAEAHGQLAVWSYYAGDDAAAWHHTLAAQALGHELPPQFIQRLETRSATPAQPN
jgi:Flp pilus assembly protein TadD